MSNADPIRLAQLDSPLGPLLAAATDDGLVLLEFDDGPRASRQLQRLRRHLRGTVTTGDHPHLALLRQELAAYFSGTLRQFSVALRYPGTDFQRQAWDALLQIPYGATRSYEAQALALGQPGASRAVGTCNGLNRIAILVPCHRLVNKAGTLGGYGGGLWRKQRLLELERGAPLGVNKALTRLRPGASRHPPAARRP